MSLSLLSILTFVAAALVVAGVYSFVADVFLQDRSRAAQRLDEEFARKQRARIQKTSLFKDLGKLAAEGFSEVDPSQATLTGRLQTMVEQSGLDITPQKLLIITAATGAGVGILAALLFWSVVGGLIAGVLAAGLPFLYVHVVRKKRLNKLLAQLADALELMARAIRAGQTMTQALQAIADEFEAPIGPEFAYCYEQQNLGLPPEIAFQDLARRTGLLEVKIFIMAMLVQRQTGGNLSELLEKLSSVVRDRFHLTGKIRSLTAEGRAQAAVLQIMPPVVFVLMMVLNRKYAEVLLSHPNYLIGLGVSMALGALWIRKIVNFDY
jgi:tight adherence protein B